jgi:hypothetical protein
MDKKTLKSIHRWEMAEFLLVLGLVIYIAIKS